MRLSENQVEAIRRTVAETFGTDAQVWLFGSRVDDSKRGGDIDLLIRLAPAISDNLLLRKIRLLVQLELALGECKVDIVIEQNGDTRPIVQVAHQTGIRL